MMEFNTVSSHASLTNGGETKTRPASQPVRLLGNRELPLTVFKPALVHAAQISSGDLTTKPVLLIVLLLELLIQVTVSLFADLLVQITTGGDSKTANASHHVTIHGRL